MIAIKCYESTFTALYFIFNLVSEFAGAEILEGRFAECQFGKGPICPASL